MEVTIQLLFFCRALTFPIGHINWPCIRLAHPHCYYVHTVVGYRGVLHSLWSRATWGVRSINKLAPHVSPSGMHIPGPVFPGGGCRRHIVTVILGLHYSLCHASWDRERRLEMDFCSLIWKEETVPHLGLIRGHWGHPCSGLATGQVEQCPTRKNRNRSCVKSMKLSQFYMPSTTASAIE